MYGFVYDLSKGMAPLVYLVGLVAKLFTALSCMTMVRADPTAGSVDAYAGRALATGSASWPRALRLGASLNATLAMDSPLSQCTRSCRSCSTRPWINAFLMAGFSLLALTAAPADAAGAGAGAGAKHKLLVVSVDGLDWRYLRDRDAMGLSIPNIRRLMREGEAARASSACGRPSPGPRTPRSSPARAPTSTACSATAASAGPSTGSAQS